MDISWTLSLRFALDIAQGIGYLQGNTLPDYLPNKGRPKSTGGPFGLKESECTDKVAGPQTRYVISIQCLIHFLDCAKISDFGTAKIVYEPIVGTMVENPVWLAPGLSILQS